MIRAGMNAAIAHQTHQMHGAFVFTRALNRPNQNRVSEKTAVNDCLADLSKLLNDHASGANIQMPDLGITHEPRRQSYSQSGSVKRAVGKTREQVEIIRGFRGRNGIALFLLT